MSRSGYMADIWSVLRQPHSPSRNGLDLCRHLNLAVEWIRVAHEAVGRRGISKGYDLLRGAWAPAYPETTGYTVPTLLNVANLTGRGGLRAMAIDLADYLLTQVTAEGGVAHWQDESQAQPIIFDTGQVLFGWLAAYGATSDRRFLDASRSAADWIVSVQHQSGSWRTYQHLGVEKVIDTRVAWALLSLRSWVKSENYEQAAKRNLEWALQQQEPDGWFRHCAFVEGDDPFTHTLAYTAEGLLECGYLLQDERYVVAAKRMADALLDRQHPDGSLASTYGRGWRESSRSSCLTGNCQMARLWLRLYETSGDRTYLEAATKAVTFVASTQVVRSGSPHIHGAIAGSYPVYGRYERLKYPNWAAKFFIDACMALKMIEDGGEWFEFVG